MKSSWRSPDGGSSVARNTKIEPSEAVFCAWWGTGSTPIRSFHIVSRETVLKFRIGFHLDSHKWSKVARSVISPPCVPPNTSAQEPSSDLSDSFSERLALKSQ